MPGCGTGWYMPGWVWYRVVYARVVYARVYMVGIHPGIHHPSYTPWVHRPPTIPTRYTPRPATGMRLRREEALGSRREIIREMRRIEPPRVLKV